MWWEHSQWKAETLQMFFFVVFVIIIIIVVDVRYFVDVISILHSILPPRKEWIHLASWSLKYCGHLLVIWCRKAGANNSPPRSSTVCFDFFNDDSPAQSRPNRFSITSLNTSLSCGAFQWPTQQLNDMFLVHFAGKHLCGRKIWVRKIFVLDSASSWRAKMFAVKLPTLVWPLLPLANGWA